MHMLTAYSLVTHWRAGLLGAGCDIFLVKRICRVRVKEAYLGLTRKSRFPPREADTAARTQPASWHSVCNTSFSSGGSGRRCKRVKRVAVWLQILSAKR